MQRLHSSARVGHLTFHHVRPNHSFKRTASPPLNSNVRPQMNTPLLSAAPEQPHRPVHRQSRLKSMSRSKRIFLSVSLLAASLGSGCVSFFALDPYLDKAVGQAPGATPYPQIRYQREMGESDFSRTVEYSIDSLWRCRWVYEIEKSTGVVKSWSYPDQDAMRWCSELPASRP